MNLTPLKNTKAELRLVTKEANNLIRFPQFFLLWC